MGFSRRMRRIVKSDLVSSAIFLIESTRTLHVEVDYPPGTVQEVEPGSAAWRGICDRLFDLQS